MQGGMARCHQSVPVPAPFLGYFGSPREESPTGDGHLTPETTGVVPSLLGVLLLISEAAAAAAPAHGEVVSAGRRIDVQGMGAAGGRGGI